MAPVHRCEILGHPSMGTWSERGLHTYLWLQKRSIDQMCIFCAIYGDLRVNLFRFWFALLWGPGLTIDRFCSNLAHAFIVSQKVYLKFEIEHVCFMSFMGV